MTKIKMSEFQTQTSTAWNTWRYNIACEFSSESAEHLDRRSRIIRGEILGKYWRMVLVIVNINNIQQYKIFCDRIEKWAMPQWNITRNNSACRFWAVFLLQVFCKMRIRCPMQKSIRWVSRANIVLASIITLYLLNSETLLYYQNNLCYLLVIIH